MSRHVGLSVTVTDFPHVMVAKLQASCHNTQYTRLVFVSQHPLLSMVRFERKGAFLCYLLLIHGHTVLVYAIYTAPCHAVHDHSLACCYTSTVLLKVTVYHSVLCHAIQTMPQRTPWDNPSDAFGGKTSPSSQGKSCETSEVLKTSSWMT